MIALLLALATARAETAEVELLRPDGQSFARTVLPDPVDGQQVVIPDGEQAWSVTVQRELYDGRLKLCTLLSQWQVDGAPAASARACVTLAGRESPQATVLTRTDQVHLRLTVKR